MLLALIGSSAACAKPQKQGNPMKPMDLWTLIDYLPTRTPFTKEKVEQALRIVLPQVESSNELVGSFKGGPVLLTEEMEVEGVELRVAKEDPANMWQLSLLLAGRCVERTAVLARYQGMKVTQTPRGRSPDEVTAWSRQELWGELSFGFAERNRDCLRRVLFTGPKW
jgi:hypothetical protein